MRSFIYLRESLHNRILRLRNLETFLSRLDIQDLFKRSSEDQKLLFESLLWLEDVSALRKWVQKHPELQYEDLTNEQLKEVARRKNLKGYSRVSRKELLRILRHASECN